MAYTDFDKLKTFFLALNKSGYHPDRMDPEIITPKDKAYCFNWLRENIPDFKDKDNSYISEYLRNPEKVKKYLLGKFTQKEGAELAKTLEEPTVAEEANKQQIGQETSPEQTMPAGSGDTSAGGMPGMGMPPTPSMPRAIHSIPHTPEPPKPDIAIANKSGVVAERPPTEFHVTDKAGNIQATYSKEPLPAAPQSKLVVPGAEKGDPSKLVSARSDGSIIKPTTPPSKIAITDSSGNILREHTIPTQAKFNFSSFFKSVKIHYQKIQNFVGRPKIWLRSNLNRIANSFKGASGRIARKMLGPRLASFLGRGLGLISRLAGLSGKVAAMKTAVSAALKAFIFSPHGLLIVGGIAFVSILIWILFTISEDDPIEEFSSSVGSTSTIPANFSTCKFTRAGNPQPIKSSILLGWISNAAASASIPPAVLASIAMHESQNFVANADNNHDAIKSNQYCNKGLIFCEKDGQVLHNKSGEDDPCTADEIASGAKNAQAVGLMQLLDIYNPGKNLCSITENLNIAATKLKGGGITLQPTKDQVTAAIKSYYNSCTYGSYNYCDEVWQDVQNCQPAAYQPGAGKGVISCPLISGYITTGSKDTPGGQGHCSTDYQKDYPCAVPDVTGRATAVDLVSSDKNVFWPYVNGEKVTWTIDEPGTAINDNEGGGVAVAAFTSSQGKTYRIRYIHLASSNNLEVNKKVNSGDLIGSYLTHLHVTLQENDEFKPGDLFFNLCQ